LRRREEVNIDEKRKQWESRGWFKFYEEKLGSVIKLEKWKSASKHEAGGYVLYREDTGEIVREDLLPDEETLPDEVRKRIQALRDRVLME
jgi:hypothetical protein